MAYGQRGLNAFGDCKVLVWLEEADRGASDAAGEEPLRFSTQRLLAILQVGPMQRHGMPIESLNAGQHGRVLADFP